MYRSAKGLSQPIYFPQNYMKIIINVEVEIEGTSISLSSSWSKAFVHLQIKVDFSSFVEER